MARPSLALPTSPRSSAYAEVIRRLKAWPALARVVKTWSCWDGSGRPGALSLAQMPHVEITPVGSPARWDSTVRHDAPLLIQAVIHVPGTDWRDAENLWQQVVAALFTDSWAASLGVEVISLLEHSAALQAHEDDAAIVVTGQFRLRIRISTSFGVE